MVAMLAAELYPPYQRPPLTKEYLRGEMGRDGLWIEEPEWYTDNGVELRLATRVKALDRQQNIIETEGGEFPYDACVLRHRLGAGAHTRTRCGRPRDPGR